MRKFEMSDTKTLDNFLTEALGKLNTQQVDTKVETTNEKVPQDSVKIENPPTQVVDVNKPQLSK